MDRRLFTGPVCLLLTLVTQGCSAPQNFFAAGVFRSTSDSCGTSCTCEDQICCGSSTERCERLITAQKSGSCTADCECGCTGEGCSSRKRRKGRRTGLAGGFERGRSSTVLDGAGWIVGIPAKLLLWNTKVDSHSVSPETEAALRRYLASQGLDDVKVRVNQYDPIGEWKRLAGNKSIHPGWRYTVGALTLTRYTLTPGRLFGNDEYNPFTNTISLYSDRASLALREGAHARQALEATYPGLWATGSYLPGSPVWVDTPAIREVVRFTQRTNQRNLEREAYLVLFPAFGARVGQSATLFLDVGVGQAAQAGFALVGHAVGRTMAFRVSETPTQMVKSVYGIVKRPEDEPIDEETAELQNPIPPGSPFPVKFIPLEVIYDSDDDSI